MRSYFLPLHKGFTWNFLFFWNSLIIESFLIVLKISSATSHNGQELESAATAVHLGQEMQTKGFTVSNTVFLKVFCRFKIYIVP